MENILPQMDSFYRATNSIKSLSTRLYLLNFSKLKVLDPIEVNYYVAIRTNYSESGQALKIVS